MNFEIYEIYEIYDSFSEFQNVVRESPSEPRESL